MRLRGYSSPWAEALLGLDWAQQSHASLLAFDEDLHDATPSEYCLTLPVVVEAADRHAAQLREANFLFNYFNAPQTRLDLAPRDPGAASSFDRSMRKAADALGVALDPNWTDPSKLLSPLNADEIAGLRARLDQALADPDHGFAPDFGALRDQLG